MNRLVCELRFKTDGFVTRLTNTQVAGTLAAATYQRKFGLGTAAIADEPLDDDFVDSLPMPADRL
ncbi:hypothetical protein AJ88_23785 [Mesorhizobium amorphae CCBAU 01583]|nr:hypothetical protein AJ88_23785 [Mesorhizobium amorphae CCBAU 01583]